MNRMIASRFTLTTKGATSYGDHIRRSTGRCDQRAVGAVSVRGAHAGIPATGQVVSVAGLEGIHACRARRADTGLAKPGTPGGRDRKDPLVRRERSARVRADGPSRAVGHHPARHHRAVSCAGNIQRAAPASLSGRRGIFLLGGALVDGAGAVGEKRRAA